MRIVKAIHILGYGMPEHPHAVLNYYTAPQKINTEYCEPIYRLGFSCISAGSLTCAWLAAFFAPPPRGYWRMVRRLRELEKKEAEEEERIREMYAKHFAKNRAASTIRSC
jgi:hypothetical protein